MAGHTKTPQSRLSLRAFEASSFVGPPPSAKSERAFDAVLVAWAAGGYSQGKLVCGVASRSERLRNCLDRDGPNIPYMISDGGFQRRQHGVQLGLSLGGDGPITKESNAIF
jgi:hypothetical protein